MIQWEFPEICAQSVDSVRSVGAAQSVRLVKAAVAVVSARDGGVLRILQWKMYNRVKGAWLVTRLVKVQ